MVWNKRTTGTLIAVLVLMLLAAVKCTFTQPKPVATERHVDENGTVYIYEQYDARAGRALAPKEYALLMVTSAAMLATACNFQRRSARLGALQDRCTLTVPAVVTDVRRAKADAQIRYRYAVYNASYRYEYLGRTYESNNFCYGTGKNAFRQPIHVGDEAEICINPDKPDELFDAFAADSLKHSRTTGVFLIVVGLMPLAAMLFR